MKKQSRHFVVYFQDILLAIEQIEGFLERTKANYEVFVEDQMLQNAVLRNFEIIGEASSRLPKEIREKYSNVPWSNIISFRNYIIHDYGYIQLEIVWDTISKSIPELKSDIEKILIDFENL